MIDTLRLRANKIFALVPPPIYGASAADQIGANQSVINSVLPKLIPKIAKTNNVELISVYEGMGGAADWSTNPKFPKDCKTSNWAGRAGCASASLDGRCAENKKRRSLLHDVQKTTSHARR